uniref:Uncharacterized protein n=1 Tax=Anguilla anguilla TaxID=7936 RepID=A0A0E9RRB8_ANGAN
MCQSLLHCDALDGLKVSIRSSRSKALLSDLGEQLAPGDLGLLRQGLQVVPGLQVDDAVQVFLRGGAQDAQDEG